jgi:hypothetical protein
MFQPPPALRRKVSVHWSSNFFMPSLPAIQKKPTYVPFAGICAAVNGGR